MEITLYYFKIPFWRAEVTRLALFIGGIPFNDYRVEGKEIDDLKATGLLPNNQIAPFKQLPVLDVDGKIIAQTGAIARYCGKLSGLYPKDNDFEAAQIDQIIDTAQDINYLVTLSGRDKEKERLELARKILVGTPSKSPEVSQPSSLHIAKSAIEILLPTKKLESLFFASRFSRN